MHKVITTTVGQATTASEPRKIKGVILPWSTGRLFISLSYRPWAHRWLDHSSVMHGQCEARPSYLPNHTVSPVRVSNYTAWWTEAQKGENNLPRVITQLCPNFKPASSWSQVRCSTHFVPPCHPSVMAGHKLRPLYLYHAHVICTVAHS